VLAHKLLASGGRHLAFLGRGHAILLLWQRRPGAYRPGAGGELGAPTPRVKLVGPLTGKGRWVTVDWAAKLGLVG
jgi:hypothetical protein